ncbi:unnamed protein product [Peniophora sp. CBMAI 1063]|nr:unnamed protein product [Peniophora sp. CBMAI 1063]
MGYIAIGTGRASDDLKNYMSLRAASARACRASSCDETSTIHLLKEAIDFRTVGCLLFILREDSSRKFCLTAPEASYLGGDLASKRKWEEEYLKLLAKLSPRIFELNLSVRSVGWNVQSSDCSGAFKPTALSSLIITGAKLDNEPRADTFFGRINPALGLLKNFKANLCQFRSPCFGDELRDVKLYCSSFSGDTMVQLLKRLGKLKHLQSLALHLDEVDMMAGMRPEHDQPPATALVRGRSAEQTATRVDFRALEVMSITASVEDAKLLFDLVNAPKLKSLSASVRLDATSEGTMQDDVAHAFAQLKSASWRTLSSLFPVQTSTHLEIDKSEYEDGQEGSLRFTLISNRRDSSDTPIFNLTVIPHGSGGYVGEFLPAVNHLMTWKVVRDLKIVSLVGAESSTGQVGCMWDYLLNGQLAWLRKLEIKRSAQTILGFIQKTPWCFDSIDNVTLHDVDEDWALKSEHLDAIRNALCISGQKLKNVRTFEVVDCMVDEKPWTDSLEYVGDVSSATACK